jgi:hypothetical protein
LFPVVAQIAAVMMLAAPSTALAIFEFGSDKAAAIWAWSRPFSVAGS